MGLNQALSKFIETVKASAKDSFASFNHFGDASFFSSFPITLDAKSFIAENFSALQPRLLSARTKDLQQFLKLYPKEEVLDQASYTEISNLYLKAYLLENANPDSVDLRTLLAAFNNAKSNQFTPNALPGAKIAFVETGGVTDPTKNRATEFPVQFDMDLPVASLKGDLETLIYKKREEGPDYFIVVDVVFARTRHKTEKMESVKSEFIAGYRTEPNADYAGAEARVNAERSNLAGVRLRHSLSSCTYCGWGGLLGQALGQGIEQGAAEARLNKAVNELRSISPVVEVPLYQEYQFKKAVLDSKKIATINYCVVDIRKQSFSKHSFEIEEGKKFQVVYQLHDKDRSKELHSKDAVTENDLSKWGESPQQVKLSTIASHYMKETHHPTESKPVKELIPEMVAAKETVMIGHLAGPAVTKPKSDARFEAVVVVYNRQAGATGSGFFVRPDVVLTNYHVVQGAQYVEMKMYDGKETFGKVVKTDARLDLALIRVQSRGKPVEFYHEPAIKLGSTVEAIGHPAGLEFSITRGVISAIRKQPSLVVPGTGEVLTVQTDTTLNIGNSGGPLFLGEKVVGVVSYGLRHPKLEGLNFAIHYTEIAQFLEESLPGG